MLLSCFQMKEGVFKRAYRNQLFACLSVTIITLSHGVGLGWLSPMLLKLESPDTTPLNFVVTVQEASWIGALISMGGLTGNIILGLLLDHIGRKKAIYFLALPHACVWVLYYFATSVEFLYVARFLGGITGGACYTVVPIFLGEIADNNIRGRLTSLFSLSLNIGILIGYILSSHIPYHVISYMVIVLPVLYSILAHFYPETPQHLLRHEREQEAEQSYKFYHGFEATTKEELQLFRANFSELRAAVLQQKTNSGSLTWGDFVNKRALRALSTGFILVLVNSFCGVFAIINYMSTIFALAKSELHPDTNTIIVGVVQIIGVYVAVILVDRFGRKILMIVSTGGMAVGLAAFGMYAFFAEETDVDLSFFSWWLPVLLMAFSIFIAAIGINSVSYVILVEIMPPKIRSYAASICMGLLSFFAFITLKIFPVLMATVGLSATMWFCASVCAFGLFYISVFLKETKGKSMDKDEDMD